VRRCRDIRLAGDGDRSLLHGDRDRRRFHDLRLAPHLHPDVVSPAGGTPPDAARQALFSLVRFDSGGLAALRPVRSDARSSTFEIPDSRFSVTVTPRLPFAVTAPTRVRLTFRTPCPSGSAILPTVSGEVTAGTVNPGGQIVPADGWDGEAFAAGATAAAVRSCTRR